MAKQVYLLNDKILHYAYYSIISNYFSVYILFCKRCNYKMHQLLKMSHNWNIAPGSVKKKYPAEDSTVVKWDVVGCSSVNCCGGRIKSFCYYT